MTVIDTGPSSLLFTEFTVSRYEVMLALSLSRLLGKAEAVGAVASLLEEELESYTAVNISVLSLLGSDTGTLVDETAFPKGADEDQSLTEGGTCPATDAMPLEGAE